MFLNPCKSRYGARLIETFRSMMTDLKNEAIVLVLRAVEMILRVLPSEGAALIQPLLPGMVKMVAEGDQYPNVMSMYLSVVARLVLYAEPIFTWIVNQVNHFILQQFINCIICLCIKVKIS